MHNLDAEVPNWLQAQTQAAVDWINEDQNAALELAGVVDIDAAESASDGASYEFGVVLCDGEICAREQIRATPDGDQVRFSLAEQQTREVPPLLDPPLGVRAQWLDQVLAKYEFVVLLFYRGLW